MNVDRENSRGRFSAAGRLLPEKAVKLATCALAEARVEHLRTLILNFRDLSLTRDMSVAECYNAGASLAQAGSGLQKVAFLTHQKCPEPHDFLFTVARNRGLQVAAFLDESEALGWLGA
jgi:hypothetical protein